MAWGARSVWLFVNPALAAGVALRYLVPTPAEAAETWALPIASFAHEHRIAPLAVLFVVFSAVARYWSEWLPVVDDGSASPPSTRSVVLMLAVAGVLALGLRATAGVYEVLSASMLPTLEPEDILGGLRMRLGSGDGAGKLKRGDIVVFEKPAFLEGPAHVVKRIVGLPGDEISMHGPALVINGEEVPACDAGAYFYPLSSGGGVTGRVFVEFLGDQPHLAVFAPEDNPWRETYEVKPGEVFVLGDNRTNSVDSRFWNGGRGGGLPTTAIVASVSTWLFGVERDQRVDVRRLLRPLELATRLDGIDSAELRAGVTACLAARPSSVEKKTAP
jgi:signal peptidase I